MATTYTSGSEPSPGSRKRARTESRSEDSQWGNRPQRRDVSSSPIARASKTLNPTKRRQYARRSATEPQPGAILKEHTKRDKDFYSLDPAATVYVQCQDTMFKVHRSIFVCSECLEIFLDDHGPTTLENPYRMISPTIQEGRALFWALYATDAQLEEKVTEPTDLQRLFHLRAITKTYPDLYKIIEWVETQTRAAANDDIFMSSCSSSIFVEFVTFAIRYKYDDMLSAIVRSWCTHLFSRNCQPFPAINIIDKYPSELRELRGAAYYVYLQDVMQRRNIMTTGDLPFFQRDTQLNDEQKMRLPYIFLLEIPAPSKVMHGAPQFGPGGGHLQLAGEGLWRLAHPTS
ncbi:hypothetical protein NLJ89_g6755 [Agrocybe chaxingu]|uniref:BTB domain-containing protein n=1 Tax=Agrocybe chaxingu TaxID=84603 RepID=A0A9W8JVV8_9AGAR|nr:hypothetical protein NLJ89_g6755 [Agrocybe chaxingu]